MSTQATTMNSINKLQGNGSNTKAKPKDSGSDVQFDALFSNAMGQLGAQGQIGQQESALRKSFLDEKNESSNQEKTTPNDPAPPNPAMVWAQRDWMQPASPAVTSPSDSDNSGGESASDMSSASAINNSTAPSKQAASQGMQGRDDPGQSDSEGAVAIESQTAAEQLPGKVGSGNAASTNMAQANSPELQPTPLADTNLPDADLQGRADLQTTQALAAGSANEPTGKALSRKPARAMQSDTSSAGSSSNAPTPRGALNGQVDAMVIGAGNQAPNPATAQLNNPLAQQLITATGNTDDLPGIQAGEKVLANRGSAPGSQTNMLAVGLPGLGSSSPNIQQTQIRTPVHQPGFAKELSNTVQWAIGKNLSMVDIRVNPESFGPMNMRLVQQGQQVQLIIRTQDEASANLLQQALGGLKEAMAQNGLQLNQVQVYHQGSTNLAHGQSSTNQNQQGQSSQGDGRQQRNSPDHGATEPGGANTSVSRKTNVGNGRLDLFA
ncbi:MAG TPA: flagellar hook-length control protein FliK [Limnobacter sp.]|nr:flagellar hook-length control protein FliK [Limnobacter sp.]